MMINSQLAYAVVEWERRLEAAAEQRRLPAEPRSVESAELPPAPRPRRPARAYGAITRRTPCEALPAYEYEPGCCD